ncbi:hypothetical protein [Thermoactinomyces sp. CICC 10522]|uniref:hypothetical protein n=1 Tax=Thermoactinomyces sp. CICC 10522 TaxID=2767427 RepID=UPI0018DD5EFD|nr:hypothetical protein [Thermoactinomyces sp. CICC 10522]MBH8605620.1 hypothetical protein [Thermoactinomyces sp. CICC 10522]
MNQLIRGAIGNLKQEGMHLTEPEMELLEAYAEKRITEGEFNRRALELALGEPQRTY